MEEKPILTTIPKYLDSKYTLKERKVFFQEQINKQMNPDKDFNPETFDPMKGVPEYEVGKRDRVVPPKELLTYDLKPKQILEGQMIGMFESKQDLYLIFAHRCNELQKKIEELEAKINGT